MSRSQNSFIKKKKAENKRKKKKAKFEKRLEKKNQPKSGELDDMIAYVDEFGNFTSEPPAKKPIKKKDTTDNKQDKQ